jgi:hypothetical protein
MGRLGVGCRDFIEPVQSAQKHHQKQVVALTFFIFKYHENAVCSKYEEKMNFQKYFYFRRFFYLYSYIRSKWRGTCTASAILIRVKYVDRDFLTSQL